MLVVVAEDLVVRARGERRADSGDIAHGVVAALAREERRPTAGVRDAQAAQAQVVVVAGAVAVRPVRHTGAGRVPCRTPRPAVADGGRRSSQEDKSEASYYHERSLLNQQQMWVG